MPKHHLYRAPLPPAPETEAAVAAALPKADFRPRAEAVALPLDGEVGPGTRFGELASEPLGQFTLTGTLPLAVEPWADFTTVLTRGAELVARGRLVLRVGYEEAESRQDATCYERLELTARHGRWFVTSAANGSRVAADPAYARRFLARFVSHFSLPVRLRDDGEHYFVEAEPGVELFLSNTESLAGASPRTVRAEVPGADPRALLARFPTFLAAAASPRRFELGWEVTPDSLVTWEPLPTAPALLAAALAAELPATRCHLRATVFVSDLGGFERLRPFLAPGASRVLPLGEQRGKGRAVTWSVVMALGGGSWLDVESKTPLTPAELAATGLNFEVRS